MIPQVTPLISTKVKRMPGISIRVGEDCSGCGLCIDGICFVNAISMNDGVAAINEACRGCGNCIIACPDRAIELVIDDHQFIEETISHITPLVDIT
jgi:MinD superfamily P-loop ATPase